MRIVMENGSHHLRNLGDFAMLRTAVTRLREIWPDARIDVITDAPGILTKYCPDVFPLSGQGPRAWLNSRSLSGRLRHYASLCICSFLEKSMSIVNGRIPRISKTLKIKLDRRRNAIEDMNSFVHAVASADLVFVSGGGFLTDSFRQFAMEVLTIIGLGLRKGKKTALFGQGIGPISSPELFRKAAAILPSVDLITSREKKKGPELLNRLKVGGDCIMTTGDEAIEIAWKARKELPGTGIGINLRIAPYSGVGREQIAALRSAIQRSAGRHKAALIPVPISFMDKESDVATIRHILWGYPAELCLPEPEEDLLKVLEQVGLCRIVITGCYHSAVFGLAQGIPAICVAESRYYKDKFGGLADQFGCGVEIVTVSDPGFEQKLGAAIDKMWVLADKFRPVLQQAARRQIDSGRAAYQKLQNIMESDKELESTASEVRYGRNVSSTRDKLQIGKFRI